MLRQGQNANPRARHSRSLLHEWGSGRRRHPGSKPAGNYSRPAETDITDDHPPDDRLAFHGCG
jgi:hypothetical protein